MNKIIAINYKVTRNTKDNSIIVSKGDSIVMTMTSEEILKDPVKAQWKIADITGAGDKERARIKAEKTYEKELKKAEKQRERDYERQQRMIKLNRFKNKVAWNSYIALSLVTYPVVGPYMYLKEKLGR